MENQVKIEEKLVAKLKERQLTITTAESCTAGLIAATIVNVSGASKVFHEGYITYCDDAKHKLLGVRTETLEKYFAVSKETAVEMAQGGRKAADSDMCISVTGVAGPDTEDGKPVGLVYIACCLHEKIMCKEYHFTGDRKQIRMSAVYEALQLAYEAIA